MTKQANIEKLVRELKLVHPAGSKRTSKAASNICSLMCKLDIAEYPESHRHLIASILDVACSLELPDDYNTIPKTEQGMMWQTLERQISELLTKNHGA